MKKLILCLDGTWDRADQVINGAPCPTNVVKLAFRIAKHDGGVPQVIFYEQGVGTGNLVDRFSGGAFGDGLEDNIHAAYRFLIANYEWGDELFLFGFSRGAFTARSLAGMIRKCGILRRDAVVKYVEALALYRDEQHPDDDGPSAFRRRYAMGSGESVKIRFVGVWDTVGALGIPLRGLRWLTRREYQFHDTELSGTVERAHQALAIDERRGPYSPTLWCYKPKPGQIVEQIWFCGAHGDVGGGNPCPDLSDSSLGWMLGRARDGGLALDADALAAYALRPNVDGPITETRVGVYRFTGVYERPIGLLTDRASCDAPPGGEAIDPTQSLHESVLRRWDADPGYRPVQLRAYLQRAGDARAGRA